MHGTILIRSVSLEEIKISSVERFGPLVLSDLPRARPVKSVLPCSQPEAVANIAREVGCMGLQTCITNILQIIFN